MYADLSQPVHGLSGALAAAAHPTILPEACSVAGGGGDGYQHLLSGPGPRRQGAREGGDAPECTYAELARPQRFVTLLISNVTNHVERSGAD
jgi:hypothetical protein